MVSNRNILCISLEVICLVSMLVSSFVVTKWLHYETGGLQPFKRGFFCDDETIQKPMEQDIVPFDTICAVGLMIALLMIIILEIDGHFPKNRRVERLYISEEVRLGPLLIPQWIIRPVYWTILLGFFTSLLMVFLGVTKLLVGRLRPFFLAACKPNTTLFNCSEGYITRDVCTGDPKEVNFARQSFPSAHAAASSFFMVFTALCVQALFCLRRLHLCRTLLQTLAILAAVSIGLSRILQYLHHWGDVLAGFIIGTLVALLLVFKAMRIFEEREVSAESGNYTLLQDDKTEEH